MQPFAKLYWADDVGQVLATIDDNEVLIRFVPPGLGVSAIRACLPDTEGGQQKAQRLFDRIDEEFALGLVRKVLAEPDFKHLLATPKGMLDA